LARDCRLTIDPNVGRVGLDAQAIPTYEELKLGKKLAYVIYKLSPDNKIIVVEKQVPKTEDDKEDYEKFISELPEKECRYIVYDFTYDTAEGKRNKILFITWAPDEAPVRAKMVSASSKDALRRGLQGIHAEIQGTDLSEVCYETVLAKFIKE